MSRGRGDDQQGSEGGSALTGYLGRLPLVGPFVRRRGWYPWRHQWVLWFGSRENVTFTQFLRLPRQYDALTGPVLDFLRADGSSEALAYRG